MDPPGGGGMRAGDKRLGPYSSGSSAPLGAPRRVQ